MTRTPIRCLFPMIALLAACSGKPAVAPETATPATPALFAGLRGAPKTLHYVVNRTAVACHLLDAGLPGDDDFTVACEPSEAPPWRCAMGEGAELPAARSAPDLWRTDGCYVIRDDGLWHLPSCPGEEAAARILPRPPQPYGDEPLPLPLQGAATTIRCDSLTAQGEEDEAYAQHCDSPDYGFALAHAAYSRPELRAVKYGYGIRRETCSDESALVAVEPGLRPPRACAFEQRLAGAWLLASKVATADPAEPQREHPVRLDVTVGEGCALEATVATGDGAPAAAAPVAIAACGSEITGTCFRVGAEPPRMTLWISRAGDQLQGVWQGPNHQAALRGARAAVGPGLDDPDLECIAASCSPAAGAEALRCDGERLVLCGLRE